MKFILVLIFSFSFNLFAQEEIQYKYSPPSNLYVGISLSAQPLGGAQLKKSSLSEGIYLKDQVEGFGLYDIISPNIEFGIIKGNKTNSFSFRFAKHEGSRGEYKAMGSRRHSYRHINFTYKNKFTKPLNKNFSGYIGHNIFISELKYKAYINNSRYQTDFGDTTVYIRTDAMDIKNNSLSIGWQASTGLSYKKDKFLVGLDMDVNILGVVKNFQNYRMVYSYGSAAFHLAGDTGGIETGNKINIITPDKFWKNVFINAVTLRVAYLIK